MQLEGNEKAVFLIKTIKQKTGATSVAEVVRNALIIYHWILDYSEKGYELRFVKDKEGVEVLIPSAFFLPLSEKIVKLI